MRAAAVRALAGVAIAVACNPVLGLEDDYFLVDAPDGGGATGRGGASGAAGSAGTAGDAGADSGGGSAGSAGSSANAGSAGDAGPDGSAGVGGADAGADADATTPATCSPACSAPTPVCRAGACRAPKSCAGLPEVCGPSAASSCCTTIQVPGGSFKRSYDGVTALDGNHPAEVSSFALDALEVTVGRFRRFVEEGGGNQNAPPATGSGSVHGATNSGWRAAWTEELPPNKAALVAGLKCQAGFHTWTDAPGANEARPMTCVTWYEAQAFCIAEGGRLPTEAEWNFAAAGGEQQRVYPWSIPATSTTITPAHTSYYADDTRRCFGDGVIGCTGADVLVGGHKSGLARWGHADLAGNAHEWVYDFYAIAYLNPCVDCAQLASASDRVLRGGSFARVGTELMAAARDHSAPVSRNAEYGFRCAYGR